MIVIILGLVIHRIQFIQMIYINRKISFWHPIAIRLIFRLNRLNNDNRTIVSSTKLVIWLIFGKRAHVCTVDFETINTKIQFYILFQYIKFKSMSSLILSTLIIVFPLYSHKKQSASIDCFIDNKIYYLNTLKMQYIWSVKNIYSHCRLFFLCVLFIFLRCSLYWSTTKKISLVLFYAFVNINKYAFQFQVYIYCECNRIFDQINRWVYPNWNVRVYVNVVTGHFFI